MSKVARRIVIASEARQSSQEMGAQRHVEDLAAYLRRTGLPRRLRLLSRKKVPTIRTESFLSLTLDLSREGRGTNLARVMRRTEPLAPLRERDGVRGKQFVSSPSAPAPDGSGCDARNDAAIETSRR